MSESRTYPIILAHGIARFDFLSDLILHIDNDAGDDGLHYFRNIRTHLMAHGFDVFHSRVGWAADVEVRANDLKLEVERVLKETKAAKVHIIAHSMGGLDSRHMLYKNREQGLHERIASVTSIGTPHLGSAVADYMTAEENLESALVKAAVQLGLGPGIAGLWNLTTEACAAFNKKVESWESNCGVRFRTYAGAQKWHKIFLPIRPFSEKMNGPNDGLVPVESARWKDEYFVGPVLDADHLNFVGWADISELPDFLAFFGMEAKIKKVYLNIAEDLAHIFPLDEG
jgi:triacylglycerol lipase